MLDILCATRVVGKTVTVYATYAIGIGEAHMLQYTHDLITFSYHLWHSKPTTRYFKLLKEK
jgi:hypothetical protein